MKTLAVFAAAISLLGMTGLSHAATLASPAIPTLHATDFEGGSLFGTTGACYVRNIGRVPVSLTVEFQQNFGVNLAASFQNCNAAPLAPGRTCVALINDLPDDVVFSCHVTASGSPKSLRAMVEQRGITSAGLKVIVAERLR
jgi:hypothetical protein